MIKNLWDIEKQNKNIQNIIDFAGKIYNKMKNFMDKIDSIEKNLNNAKKSCVEAKNYLQNGRGNVLKTCDKMMILGGKNDRELLSLEEATEEVLDEDLLEDAGC
jgi:DNA recombination protein RmuC